MLHVITHLVADVGIRALLRGSFVRTFGHGHVVNVLLVAVGCYRRPDGHTVHFGPIWLLWTHDPNQNAHGSFCHRISRGLVLGARDFQRLEAAVGIQGRAFRLLLIVPTPSNAPKCRGSKRGTHRPPGWHPRTRGNKIGPCYLTPAFSGAQMWADWLHNCCLLWGPTGVGIGNSPKSCPVHALRAPCAPTLPHRSITTPFTLEYVAVALPAGWRTCWSKGNPAVHLHVAGLIRPLPLRMSCEVLRLKTLVGWSLEGGGGGCRLVCPSGQFI